MASSKTKTWQGIVIFTTHKDSSFTVLCVYFREQHLIYVIVEFMTDHDDDEEIVSQFLALATHLYNVSNTVNLACNRGSGVFTLSSTSSATTCKTRGTQSKTQSSKYVATYPLCCYNSQSPQVAVLRGVEDHWQDWDHNEALELDLMTSVALKSPPISA